ncbi:hypothetical protein H5410_030425 [Solanum commersonii]|uniref:Uncharacterized protein n=1 Tax=Solanum commersonii TaxID=4109 RepID=A0A9J5YGU5_SOLCO|nr:hypothetical protein H5410_030425 [Solanum commersonii]
MGLGLPLHAGSTELSYQKHTVLGPHPLCVYSSLGQNRREKIFEDIWMKTLWEKSGEVRSLRNCAATNFKSSATNVNDSTSETAFTVRVEDGRITLGRRLRAHVSSSSPQKSPGPIRQELKKPVRPPFVDHPRAQDKCLECTMQALASHILRLAFFHPFDQTVVLQAPPEAVEVLVEKQSRCHANRHRVTINTKWVITFIWVTLSCNVAGIEPGLPLWIIYTLAVKISIITRRLLKIAHSSEKTRDSTLDFRDFLPPSYFLSLFLLAGSDCRTPSSLCFTLITLSS